VSKEDREARKARSRELAQLARNQRAHAIQKRLNDEAAAEEARKAHELRTGDRDRVARPTSNLSSDAAAAFKDALGVTPEAFRRSLLHDPNGTRGRKSLDAYNSIIRRLEKGQIEQAEKLLKSHKSRLKDTAKDGTKAADDFEKKHPRPSGGGSSSSGGGTFSWWLRGGR
jgi:hypothetical protein